MVVQRGLRQAASYHNDRLRQERIGYFFDVDHQRLRRDAGLRRAGPGARSLADRRVRARAAVQPERERSTTCRPIRRSERWSADGRRLKRINHPTASPGSSGSAWAPRFVGVVLTIVGFVMLAGADRFFEAYLVAYIFWIGIVARQHGAADGESPHRRRVGPRHSPAARSGDAHDADHGDAVHPDRVRDGRICITGRIADAVASDPVIAVEAAVSQHDVLPGPAGDLLRRSGPRSRSCSTRWSAEQDRTGDPALVSKFSILSGGGLVVIRLTVTFAMVDWTMSVNPHWFSTMWGLLFMVGQGLSALALRDRGADHAGAVSAAQPHRHGASPARSRQAPVRVPDAVGVSVVLAVPDHLVGEHGRGDPALPACA